ncbi:MAG: lycopene cyclase [Cytophagaceae bacterium]|nr:lycopene cyclase [Cytophagaceae bacterium]
MQHYDYILAGGGMAGLSLAYYLNQSELRTKRILIIDREPKLKNDRTWAFWEQSPGPFEAILHRVWETVWFYGPQGYGPHGRGSGQPGEEDFSEKLDLGGYRYKLLRGIDFYSFVRADLAKNPAVEFLYSPILAVESSENGAVVKTEAGAFSADWVFDSTFRLEAMKPFNADFSPIGETPTGRPSSRGSELPSALLQHFKGWVVKTDTPAFDPAVPTMMDFRIEQHGECRFMYVLPFSETEALVEFTLFTPTILPPETYDQELKNYLKNFLQIADFQIIESEFGIIPMSAEPVQERPGPRVMRIGTAGGTTRPSTGYTFARTQRRLQRIAQNLANDPSGHPLDGESDAIPARYRLFDQIFLNVFLKKRFPPAVLFTQLYARNRPADVFRFLDEQNSLLDDLRVIWAVPKLPFIWATIDVFRQKIVPRRMPRNPPEKL